MKQKKEYLFAEKNVFSFKAMETDEKVMGHEVFIGFNNFKIFLHAAKKVFIICSSNTCSLNLIENQEMEKAEDVYDEFFEKKDAEVKE